MNVRAHKRLWTLAIADDTESRKQLEFTIGELLRFATQAEAESARNAYRARGRRCYIVPPLSAWAGKKANA